MNKIRTFWARLNLSLLAFTAFLLSSVSAKADTDVTALVTDASALWDNVKVLVLGVVGFIILMSIVKLVRKR